MNLFFYQESDSFLKLDPNTVAKEIIANHDHDKVSNSTSVRGLASSEGGPGFNPR